MTKEQHRKRNRRNHVDYDDNHDDDDNVNVGSMSPSNGKNRLSLVVFDLDYTIWKPEMYQLSSAPKLVDIDIEIRRKLSPSILQQARTNKHEKILMSGKYPMLVFSGASHALREIQHLRRNYGYDIRAAVASCTDIPSYAQICMKHLAIDDDGTTTLHSCFEKGKLVEISYGSKVGHLQRLHRKTGIPYDEMAFFDNEYGNIRSVSKLGVKCYYTPDGMTQQAWEDAKRDFGIGSIDVRDAEKEEQSDEGIAACETNTAYSSLSYSDE